MSPYALVPLPLEPLPRARKIRKHSFTWNNRDQNIDHGDLYLGGDISATSEESAIPTPARGE